MNHQIRRWVPSVLRQKPLQAGKFIGILISLVLGVAGFFRIINARGLIDDPVLGDGQFLALILIPLLSLALVCLVFIETLIAGYRLLRADDALMDRLTDRTGYTLVRGGEAVVAVVGLVIIITAVPPLVAESTPAPAGVGLMLLLMAVGLGILVMSLVRSTAELFIYRRTPNAG